MDAEACLEASTVYHLYSINCYETSKISLIGGEDRKQAYLLYHYDFIDDVEYTMIGTSIHFNLRESRAKKQEETAMDNLLLEGAAVVVLVCVTSARWGFIYTSAIIICKKR